MFSEEAFAKAFHFTMSYGSFYNLLKSEWEEYQVFTCQRERETFYIYSLRYGPNT